MASQSQNTKAQKSYIDRRGEYHIPQEGDILRSRKGIFGLYEIKNHLLLFYPQGYDDIAELPGGGIDKGEKPAKALLRETTEETGLKMPKMNASKNFKQTIKFYADDQNEYWNYQQIHRYFKLPDESDLFFYGFRETPENGMAFWQPIDHISDINIHFVHNLSVKQLISPS